ncbi:hypothetical protein FXO38_06809 [Capsicum annuum]|uniref:Uncharacterized protein n=1 Tax=Capsicum annuum TaxID=4072 RepID=A0A2G2ZG69_CAPAN|nr:hypothetical protein FXO38_06809 [Capsicum annuum]KAF3685339.1 hypothetical protein FXO37_00731 [Capsicum annuum]PHT80997.1 hypothetical protein T459_14012 [Capsicum annuum]
MRQAIKIQRSILRQGSAAITKKGSIRSGSKFRCKDETIDLCLLHPGTKQSVDCSSMWEASHGLVQSKEMHLGLRSEVQLKRQ